MDCIHLLKAKRLLIGGTKVNSELKCWCFMKGTYSVKHKCGIHFSISSFIFFIKEMVNASFRLSAQH